MPHVSESHNAAPRAVQYLRVSLDRSGHARSVDEQRADNERAAARHGWEIVASYADPNRSASRYATRTRENYERLLEDIDRRRLDVLILWEPSRGSRKVSEWVELIEVAEKRKVKFYVTSHQRIYDPANPRDRRSLLEDAVDSEFESGKVSERVSRAVKASADAGRPFGAIPYGYKRLYQAGSSSPVRQVPDPETAPVVREIVARVLAGEGLHAIAVDLNRRGVPTPQRVRDRRMGREPRERGGWNNAKIRRLLGTPTMTGWRVHQGEVHGPADWEPLVSAADHAAAKAIIDNPARRTQRGTEPRYLLSGVAQCGICGAWLRRIMNRNRESYSCAGKANTGTGHVVRQLKPLEAKVVLHVVERLEDPGLFEAIARSKARLDDTVAEAGREIARLQAQLAEYEAMAAAGGIAADAFGRVAQGLMERIDEARAKLSSAQVVPDVVMDMAGPDARKKWNDADNDKPRQRQIIRALVRVVVHKSSHPRGVRGFDESTIEIIDL